MLKLLFSFPLALRWTILVFYMAEVVVVSLAPTNMLPGIKLFNGADKIIHLILYLLLCLLTCWVLCSQENNNSYGWIILTLVLIGVLTTGDLNRLIETNDHFMNVVVQDVMNKKPKVITGDQLAVIAYQKMEEYKIIAMPVVDDKNNLQGVIHLHDLMQKGINY